jgi:putative hydrolase
MQHALPVVDLNLVAAGALRDLALAHASRHARFAYRRASLAVLHHPESIATLAAENRLLEIPGVGPSTARILREVVEDGTSTTVERAVETSAERSAVQAGREHRRNFLSRAEALRILAANLPGTVSRAEYRGDLQMHTVWSDGGAPISELVEAARARGDAYLAVSDHGYGLRIARGMSMEAAAKQRLEITALNRAFGRAFRVLQGVEANIPAAGGVDMADDELAAFDLVLAAPHSRLRSGDDQTERMLATVRHPRVDVLAHPRGRMFSRRGVLADWDRVFSEAREHGVAVEIDGDPYRQDLDFTLAARALAAGCVFALDSDAHGPDELAFSDFALAHARLAGIPAERVINTWPVDRLLAWSKRRRLARPTRARRPRPARPTVRSSESAGTQASRGLVSASE